MLLASHFQLWTRYNTGAFRHCFFHIALALLDRLSNEGISFDCILKSYRHRSNSNAPSVQKACQAWNKKFTLGTLHTLQLPAFITMSWVANWFVYTCRTANSRLASLRDSLCPNEIPLIRSSKLVYVHGKWSETVWILVESHQLRYWNLGQAHKLCWKIGCQRRRQLLYP